MRCGSVYRQCIKKFVLQCLGIRRKPRERLEMIGAGGGVWVLCVVVMKITSLDTGLYCSLLKFVTS